MKIKKIAILGSTGSIGINTLKVIDRFPKTYRVVALTAFSNTRLLEKQIKKYKPHFVAANIKGVHQLKQKKYAHKMDIFDAAKDLAKIVTQKEVDIVVIGIRGGVALLPFLKAVRCGKTVAPANKEALVMAGHIIMREAKKHKARIIPIDSEQSAIFQCLNGNGHHALKKIYLTASGGPLHNMSSNRFDDLSVKDVLKHPRWKMGKKISIDSATLMNKGLEIIEAKWLFNLNINDIEVVIHPQAVIHSMVEFQDGSILAQMGITDMRLPIQYALTYPQRLDTGLNQLDFFKCGKLTFDKPNVVKFPALKLCVEVAKKEGTAPAVLNAANEVAVEAYLKEKIRFSHIYKIVKKVVTKHRIVKNPDLKQILAADEWARYQTEHLLEKIK